jgi:hypothetical protein
MARPERNSVDYFPFVCEEGKKMFYIEETYGNDGFATFVKILRELAKTEYHYLDLSKNTTLMFLSAKCKVPKDVLLNIIKDLSELGKFDAILWNENSIIWCQDFIDSIQDAYKKRNNKCITYQGLLTLLHGLGVRKQSLLPSTVSSNTQSKVKYSKVKESIVKNSKEFVPPSIEEVKDYFEENGYKKESGERAFKYYNVADWKDSKGNKVRNWKQKMQSVWFKDENKIPEPQSTQQKMVY